MSTEHEPARDALAKLMREMFRGRKYWTDDDWADIADAVLAAGYRPRPRHLSPSELGLVVSVTGVSAKKVTEVVELLIQRAWAAELGETP